MKDLKVKLAKISERDIEEFLVSEVKKVGGLALKFTSQGNAGVPDRLVILPDGNVHFIELKAKGKKPSKLQKVVHKQFLQRNVKVEIIDSKEEVKEWLDGIYTT